MIVFVGEVSRLVELWLDNALDDVAGNLTDDDVEDSKTLLDNDTDNKLLLLVGEILLIVEDTIEESSADDVVSKVVVDVESRGDVETTDEELLNTTIEDDNDGTILDTDG